MLRGAGLQSVPKRPRTEPPVHFLFLLPLDVWVLIRDLAGDSCAAAWNSVCREFRRTVTSAGFWAHFSRELKLHVQADRLILLLLVRQAGTAPHRLTIADLSAAAQEELVPLLAGLAVQGLTLAGPMSPGLVRAFSAIRELTLRENKYTSACLQQLTAAGSLLALHLEDSGLTDNELRQLLCRLTGLRHLSLVCCPNVTDSALGALATLPELRRLDLEDCRKITGTGLRHLPLTELNLRRRRYFFLMPRAPAALTTLPRLERLSLWRWRESDFGLLAAITSLRHLDLLECQELRGTNLPALRTLQLDSLGLALCSPRHLRHLLELPSLVELKLRNCRLTAEDLTLLQGCPRLSKLRLWKCTAVDGLDALSNLPVLSDLTLQECPAELAGLRHCRSLQTLQLVDCANVALTALRECPALRKLDLSLQETSAADVQDFRRQRPDVEVSV